MSGRIWDVLFAIFLASAVAIAPSAWIGYKNGQPLGVGGEDVAGVQLFDPAGPPQEAFTRTPEPFSEPIDPIVGAIPNPLPHPVWQGFLCRGELRLTLTISDGSTVTYGPCRYPVGIRPLYAAVLDVQTAGACRPNCGPNDTPGP